MVSFQVPAYGYQLEGLISLPRGPLQKAARGVAAGFPQSSQSEREKKRPKEKPQYFL